MCVCMYIYTHTQTCFQTCFQTCMVCSCIKVVTNCLHLKKHACLMCSLKKGQVVLGPNAFYVSAAVLNSAKSRLTANTTLTTHNNLLTISQLQLTAAYRSGQAT